MKEKDLVNAIKKLYQINLGVEKGERVLVFSDFIRESEKLEKEIIAQGWGGEIKDNKTGDYLAVVNTNIAGGKTDGEEVQDVTVYFAHRFSLSPH